MATAADITAMGRAIALAARGLGSTSPNPVVGCVITDASGAVAGEGFHQRAGGPHAEVHALRAAGERARGGTAYVTLEPCNHTGRTGPCAQALLAAGISRVVHAVGDPNPQATGGADTLRAAGVQVEQGLLAAEAEAGNAAWLTSVRLGRPYVLWKYAATLDGRIAAADATSRWITSPEARADVHRLRAEADAVIVGSGTARTDDPQLGVRGIDGATQPLRVVVDTGATAVRPGARVLDDTAPTLVAVAEDAPADHLPEDVVLRLPRAATGPGPGRRRPPRRPAHPGRPLRTPRRRAHPGRCLRRRRKGRQGRRLSRPGPARGRPRRPRGRRNHHDRAGVAPRSDRDRPDRPRSAHHRRPCPCSEGKLSVHRNCRRTG